MAEPIYSSGTTPSWNDPPRVIDIKILQALNAGAGGAAADYIAYAGPPVLIPPNIQHIVVDINRRQWQYTPANGWL
jgi:hypothetical protein